MFCSNDLFGIQRTHAPILLLCCPGQRVPGKPNPRSSSSLPRPPPMISPPPPPPLSLARSLRRKERSHHHHLRPPPSLETQDGDGWSLFLHQQPDVAHLTALYLASSARRGSQHHLRLHVVVIQARARARSDTLAGATGPCAWLRPCAGPVPVGGGFSSHPRAHSKRETVGVLTPTPSPSL